MMIDADTTFFMSPAKLWDSEKYSKTGNFLCMTELVISGSIWLSRSSWKPEVSVAQYYILNFDVNPFRSLPTLERPKAILKSSISVALNFEPSDFLLSNYSFATRTCHQVDSSLVLWNKKRQPRATAIIISFIALNTISASPSYGDKEYFFLR